MTDNNKTNSASKKTFSAFRFKVYFWKSHVTYFSIHDNYWVSTKYQFRPSNRSNNFAQMAPSSEPPEPLWLHSEDMNQINTF